MQKKKRKKRVVNKKIGALPGELIYVGDHLTEEVSVSLIKYNDEIYSNEKIKSIKNSGISFQDNSVEWVKVTGFRDMDLIKEVGDFFKLHPLMIEDVLNIEHRPKIDEFEDYVFIIIKIMYFDDHDGEFKIEQLSLVLGENWLISFQEKEYDFIDEIIKRIAEKKGLIRSRKADYLLYQLMDIITDNYFIITDKLGDVSEELEDKILNSQTKEDLKSIQDFRYNIKLIRKNVLPLREVVLALQKNIKFVEKETLFYIHDVYEHIIQIYDNVDSLKDSTSSIMDLYMSGTSNKMNEIMKVLTIYSALFIPLTFLTGIYGMNFDIIPELHWRYGYLLFWITSILSTVGMFVFFKYKKWL